jgi:NDP-sugar pyrophosphorylase family protein
MRRAFILAGGLGTRLLPYTTVLPKPLLPLGRRTILEHVLEGVATSGLTRVTISVGYLGHLVEAVIGDGSRYGVDVDYTREPSPLGTAGALFLMPDRSPDDLILALNGDTFTDFDYSKAFDEIERTDADALVVCVMKSVPVDLGILETGPTGDLITYTEKPTYEFRVSTGMNVVRGSVLTSMEPKRIDMPDLLRGIQARGGKVQCLDATCTWFDLGHVEDLQAANDLVSGWPVPE